MGGVFSLSLCLFLCVYSMSCVGIIVIIIIIVMSIETMTREIPRRRPHSLTCHEEDDDNDNDTKITTITTIWVQHRANHERMRVATMR